jgi:hypothetical protein
MNEVPGEHFSFVVFEDRPVRSQRVFEPSMIEVVFYGRPGRRYVPEGRWRERARQMLMPRRHGSRSQVLGQWPGYLQYAVALG